MEKSEEAYKIIEGLKEELNFSKARMSTMAKDLQIMIDALNSLRSKYKNMKSFRKDAITQIDDLKNMNSNLCKKLEIEMKKHLEACKANDNSSCLKDAKVIYYILMKLIIQMLDKNSFSKLYSVYTNIYIP